ITKGYGSKLMIGRFPVAAVNIQLDPLLLDVNVHPSKQEIRISKEDDLVEFLKQAVAEAMGQEIRITHGFESLPKPKKTLEERTEQTNLFWKKQFGEKPSDSSYLVRHQHNEKAAEETDWDALLDATPSQDKQGLEEAPVNLPVSEEARLKTL